MFYRLNLFSIIFLSWSLFTFNPVDFAVAQSRQHSFSLSHLKFKNRQPVHINGLPSGAGGRPISTEEPFLSRDGRFLFINTGERENNKDLHYAEMIRVQRVYKGEIGPNINNSKEVQGNPSMDMAYHFYYVDSGVEPMIRVGTFKDKLSLVQAPTLVITGRHDSQAPPPCSEELVEGIPDSKLILFEKSGHNPFVEESSLFSNTLKAFFEKKTK